MARILFVVPPLTGHINPLLPVAAVLEQQGHELAWCGDPEVLHQHLSETARVFPVQVEQTDNVQEKSQSVRGLASVKFFYESFCLPLARLSVEQVEAAVSAYQPDVLVCDHQMLAGALVAEKHHIPWVSSVTTSASILQPQDMLHNWLVEQLSELQRSCGLRLERERWDFSPHACIVFSSQALIGDELPFVPAPYEFVGPATNHKRKPIDFPWQDLQAGKKKILISLGTVSRDRSHHFYDVMLEALADQDVQVIMVAAEPYQHNPPQNFIVRDRVPQLELLPHMDLVVSHAGHNTVCETLSEGKPMVLAPIRDDQPVVAAQVVNAGAGLSVRFGKVTVKTAKNTINTVLDDAEFRRNAERIQAAFKGLDGAKSAAGIIHRMIKKTA